MEKKIRSTHWFDTALNIAVVLCIVLAVIVFFNPKDSASSTPLRSEYKTSKLEPLETKELPVYSEAVLINESTTKKDSPAPLTPEQPLTAPHHSASEITESPTSLIKRLFQFRR